MPTVSAWVRAAAAAALVGCAGGVIGDDGVGGGAPEVPAPAPPPSALAENPSSFRCDPAAAPAGAPLRRLSTPELRQTLADLLEHALGGATARAVLDEVDAELERLPTEPLDVLVGEPASRAPARYGRLVQDVSQLRVDAAYELAVAVGAAVTRTAARLEALMGRCATDTDRANDARCLDDLVEGLGAAAFRAPLDPDERAFLRDEAYVDGDVVNAVGVAELVAVVLSSPRFLYQFELGGAEPRDGAVPLRGHELAARLSYHLWGAPPDEALAAAAERGELETEAGYAAQVDRLLADPRARRTLEGFVTEWLGVRDLHRLDEGAGTAQFDAFFDGMAPSERLHEDMVAELAAFAGHVVFEAGGDLGDLFTSRAAFPHTDELAGLYGVPRWRPGEPPVELPPAERAGLLTRPAFLAIASVHPHPILRGVEIRRYVVCDELPAPPGDVALPDIDPTMSSREFVEAVTSPQPCQACHTRINALGFALGHYDALGRYITSERLFDEEGTLLGEPVVDASAEPRVAADDPTRTADALEMSALLAESAKVQACFARHQFRFTHRRLEDVERDGCALEAMRRALADGGSVVDLLRAAVLDPEFRVRRLPEGA